MSHGTTRTHVWTLFTPPLAGQSGTNLSPGVTGSSESGEKIFNKSPSGHVITTTPRRE
jgi:hypothetical protein